MIHSVNSGDSLWNIAKNYYGDSLKSNSDILEKVKKIAKDNNIENPNLIMVGQEINLEDINPTDTANENIENVNNTEEGNLFENYSKWQSLHSVNTKNYTEEIQKENETLDAYYTAMGECETNPSYENSEEYMQIEQNYLQSENNIKQAETNYNVLREKIGTSYDFMEGKNVNNETEYKEQITKLAQGDFDAKNSNGDDGVSFIEYFSNEAAEGINMYKEMIANGTITKQEAIESLKDTVLLSQAVFNIIDGEQMGGNGDGKLNTEEFANYYILLDEYQGDGTSVRDGKIDIDKVTEYPEYIGNQLLELVPPSQKTQNYARNIATKLLEDAA